MRKLLFITFICSSLCAYAQSEIPEDTIKNRPPVKKEQIPFSPKENKRTGLDESQPQQSLQGEQQEEINLHLPPSDYVEPLPWYNPQIQISAESETKRSIFREKDKTKRSKKESAQHSKSRNKSFVMTSVSAL